MKWALRTSLLLMWCWVCPPEGCAQVVEGVKEPVPRMELTPADLGHGKRQVERMLADRPGMAVYRRAKDDKAGYVGEGDVVYQWAVEAYAGKYVGERVFWMPDEPSGADANHGRVESSSLYTVQIRNMTGSGRSAFEKMWAWLAFEMHNMSMGTAWLEIQLLGLEGTVSADEYAKGCAKVEWQAIQKMDRFRQEVWLPWTVAQGFKSDEDVWRWRDQEDFEKWISHYTDPECYPWKNYRVDYDHMRQWADYYRERFKVFAPLLPGNAK